MTFLHDSDPLSRQHDAETFFGIHSRLQGHPIFRQRRADCIPQQIGTTIGEKEAQANALRLKLLQLMDWFGAGRQLSFEMEPALTVFIARAEALLFPPTSD